MPSITYSKGQYTGGITNGLPHGQGQMTYNNGQVYKGDFQKGYATGYGFLTYPNGVIYKGEVKNAKPDGSGLLTYPDGQTYLGAFKAGTVHGEAIFTNPAKGRKIEGTFLDGGTKGYGTIYYSNGDVYSGEFQNNVPHGEGQYRYANGRLETGTFVNGRLVVTPAMGPTITPKKMGIELINAKKCSAQTRHQETQICNPITGRWVKPQGEVYHNLLGIYDQEDLATYTQALLNQNQ